MTFQSFFSKSSTTGIFWGLIGGISLILATLISANGYLQVIPYFFILCATIVTTKYSRISTYSFGDLVKSGLVAFIVSSLCLYIYVLTVVNPNSGITFIGHIWRLGFIMGIGLISSSIISFIAKPVR